MGHGLEGRQGFSLSHLSEFMEASMLKHFAASLFALAALLAGIAPAAAEKRVALVIGNSAYENVPRLTNPSNDAADVAAKLKALGFEVVEGIDLGKRDMEKRIRAFAEALNGADVGLFYYAGHGLQVDQRNFLLGCTGEKENKRDKKIILLQSHCRYADFALMG